LAWGPVRLAEGGAEGFGIGHDGVARKVHASQERCAASTWPAPQASSITTGMIPRSAAWRAVGSMPIGPAMRAGHRRE